MRLLIAAFAIAMLVPSLAMAQDMGAITDYKVREFYKETNETYKKDFAAFYKFLDGSLIPNIIATQEVSVRMAGRKPKITTQTLYKKDIMKAARATHKSMTWADVHTNIYTVEIDPFGRSALVKSETLIEGMDLQGMPANARQECIDKLVIGAVGLMQIATSDCHTNIDIRPAEMSSQNQH